MAFLMAMVMVLLRDVTADPASNQRQCCRSDGLVSRWDNNYLTHPIGTIPKFGETRALADDAPSGTVT